MVKHHVATYRKYERFYSKRIWKPHFDVFQRTSDSTKKKRDVSKYGADQVKKFFLELNDFRYHAGELTQKVGRHIKVFSDYKIICKNQTPLILHTLRKFADVSKYIPLHKGCQLVGITPDYVGPTPGKVYSSSNYFIKTILDNWDEIKEKFPKYFTDFCDNMCDFRYVLNQGHECILTHFKKWCAPSECTLTFDNCIEVLEKGADKWFRSPEVEFTCDNEIYHSTNINIQANTGHYTSKLFGNKRFKTVHISVQVAHSILTKLQRYVVNNYYLWNLLGRSKDNKCIVEGTDLASRTVHNVEEPMMILLSYFANKYNKMLAKDDNKRIYTGKKYDTKAASNSYELEQKYDLFIDADWELFDCAAVEPVMVVAIALLCANTKVDKFHQRIIYLIISSIVTKFVVVYPGLVYKVTKGFPSGHPFTNTLGTYANLLYWSIIGYRLYGDNFTEMMELEVSGDDSRVYFKYSDRLFEIDNIIKEMGLKCDTILGNFCPTKGQIDHNLKPDFLKRRYVDGVLKWDSKKIIRKLCFQSKPHKQQEELAVVENYILTAPCDTQMNAFLLYIYDKMRSRMLHDNPTLSLYDIDAVEKRRLQQVEKQVLTTDHMAGFKYTENVMRVDVTDKPERYAVIHTRELDLLYSLSVPPDFLNENRQYFLEKIDVDKYTALRGPPTFISRILQYISEF